MPFSRPDILVNSEKPCKTAIFVSWGEYAQQ